ncbi:MAG: efflux RND transporter periplasmic adaptor subunit [Hyphomicrobiales bacterium]|nr:efflux RND transporter periplasmic adaptor subunit [Methylobacteriaceae bacterium]MCC2104120.1 efflux RND transporter periplasmic adaptor subunit [Hyphomicrobiales bacterium]
MRSSRLLIWFLVLALIGGGAFFGWRRFGAAPLVAVVEVKRGSVAEVVYATGVVEPTRWAKVIAYQRKRIIDICDCEGKTVKAGDILARLDDTEEKANVAELEARRALLKNDVDRVTGLYKLNAATKTALDQAITALREYDARIEARKQKLADLVLRAPIDGVVLKREGHIGDMAGTGVNDALFWVGRPKPLRVDADVNEEDMPRVRIGQKVLLRHDGFPGQALEAVVDDITPKGDPQTKTFRVYLALPDDTPLRIGMSVEANIVIAARQSALIVPAEAVVNGAVDRVVNGVVARTQVKTGVRGVRLFEILSGLEEGALVVSPARPNLKNGARIRVSGP